jgi:hypothetical protein
MNQNHLQYDNHGKRESTKICTLRRFDFGYCLTSNLNQLNPQGYARAQRDDAQIKAMPLLLA